MIYSAISSPMTYYIQPIVHWDMYQLDPLSSVVHPVYVYMYVCYVPPFPYGWNIKTTNELQKRCIYIRSPSAYA